MTDGTSDSGVECGSPYYLTSSDAPGNLITYIQLKEDNYEEWAKLIKGSLNAKNKTGFIDGSIERPTDSDVIDDWQQGNGPRVHQIKTDLAECKQKVDNIGAYFGRIKKLWDDLNDFDTLPVCICRGCKCDITGTLVKEREEERLYQFLMGLNTMTYGTTRSNILSQESLPSVNWAYSLVVQVERVGMMNRRTEEKPDQMSFAVHTNPAPRSSGDNKEFVCTHCKRKGHSVKQCFELMGYPEWWDHGRTKLGRQEGCGRGSSAASSSAQGRSGQGKSSNRAHAVQKGSNNLSAAQGEGNLFGLSKEQWAKRLKKSLYGLRQAPRCWFTKLSTALKKYGFRQSYFDYSLFSYQNVDTHIHVLVYVDDLVIGGLSGSRPVVVPIEQNYRLALSTRADMANPEQYRRLVCVHICVHILSQFVQQPKVDHWSVALRVVHYLNSRPGQGILLRADSALSVTAFCDSDWVACPITRRLSLLTLFYLVDRPYLGKLRNNQPSPAEAEYRVMTSTICELKWLRGLLSTLGISHPHPMRLFCDSQSALHIARNAVFHERTKHIEVDCHFIQDGLVAPAYVHTSAQLADILTKALGVHQFEFLLGKLGVFNLHAPT